MLYYLHSYKFDGSFCSHTFESLLLHYLWNVFLWNLRQVIWRTKDEPFHATRTIPARLRGYFKDLSSSSYIELRSYIGIAVTFYPNKSVRGLPFRGVAFFPKYRIHNGKEGRIKIPSQMLSRRETMKNVTGKLCASFVRDIIKLFGKLYEYFVILYW